MISRLRENHERNLRDYKKQSQKTEKRIAENEKWAKECSKAAMDLRKQHIKV